MTVVATRRDGIGAALGWVLDRALGEPPTRWHPVAAFGRAMTALERRTWRDTRSAGAVHLLAGVGGAAAVGLALERLLGARGATVLATAVAVAGRMLGDEALAVARLAGDGDAVGARERVVGLVGRDVATLDDAGIARAVIESVAENTVDAVIAPVMWAAVGGAPAVLAHRAINTLDAMVGHHSDRYERFGWASARADDAAAWIPARVAGLAVAAVRPRRARVVTTVVRRDAGAHPSPNGGVVEAAFAAALDVGLGGVNRYADRIEDRGRLGDGPEPTFADVEPAVRLSRDIGAAVALGVTVLPGVLRRLATATAPRSGARSNRAWRRP